MSQRKKTKNELLGKDAICTFSQCGEAYVASRFTKEKVMHRSPLRDTKNQERRRQYGYIL